MVSLTFSRLASREIDDAYEWYAAIDIDLAIRFDNELRKVLEDIQSNCHRFSNYDERTKQASLKVFPYSIIYRIASINEVIIVALSHNRRMPDYWQDG